jgi:hypothetical protein
MRKQAIRKVKWYEKIGIKEVSGMRKTGEIRKINKKTKGQEQGRRLRRS